MIKTILKKTGLFVPVVSLIENTSRFIDGIKLKLGYIHCQINGYRVNKIQRIRIELASVCNLRCAYCPTGVNYKSPNVYRGLMSEEIFNRLVEEIKNIESLHTAYLYLGGEPLINKNLTKMSKILKERTHIKDLSFITNGMLITEEFCKSLEGSGIDRITISIDGRTPEENDRYRVGANYEKIRENVRMLKKYADTYGIRLQIGNIIIPTKDELDKAPETPEFLRKDFPDIHIMTYYARLWPGLSQESLDKEKLKLFIPYTHHICHMPFYEVDIRANGDVIMCCNDLLSECVMGNIMTTPLMDIFNGDKYKEVRESMIKGHNIPEMCKRCEVMVRGLLYHET